MVVWDVPVPYATRATIGFLRCESGISPTSFYTESFAAVQAIGVAKVSQVSRRATVSWQCGQSRVVTCALAEGSSVIRDGSRLVPRPEVPSRWCTPLCFVGCKVGLGLGDSSSLRGSSRPPKPSSPAPKTLKP